MTAFAQKSFTVQQSGKVDPRRDCAKENHWPRLNRRGEYECFFCKQPCQVDGTDRLQETTK